MKIDDHISRTKASPYAGETQAPAGESKTPAKNGEAAPAGTADTVQLSDRAREVARAQELAGAAPAVRAEKVEQVKARVEAGTYEVKAEEVAEKVILDALEEVV